MLRAQSLAVGFAVFNCDTVGMMSDCDTGVSNSSDSRKYLIPTECHTGLVPHMPQLQVVPWHPCLSIQGYTLVGGSVLTGPWWKSAEPEDGRLHLLPFLSTEENLKYYWHHHHHKADKDNNIRLYLHKIH